MTITWLRHLQPSWDTSPARPAPFLARRRGILAGGAALAAALGGCVPPDQEPPGTTPPAELAADAQPPAPAAESALTQLRQGADPVIAGQALDGTLLRRLYAPRGFEPLWDGQAARAEALAAAVMRAADHGLLPERVGGALLPRLAQFAPLERELLLSHAVLTYAGALAGGAMPPARRRDAEALLVEPADAPAALLAALDSDDPVAVIEDLAPRNTEYEALRQVLRRDRDTGRTDPEMVERQRLLAVNLERQRWLPRRMPADRVWVNITDQTLVLFRDDQPVFTTRVVVGAEVAPMQSPEFHTTINAAFLNPPWIIPDDILRRSILPRAQADPGYLARRNITLAPDGEAEQAAGPDSALGAIMFDMPNRFDVYLHDTPERNIFELPNRRISNGCIRVENPLQLAALLMEAPLEEIEAKVATGETREEAVPRPIPVFLVYQTAFVSPGHVLDLRPDFYGRDAAIWQALQPRTAQPAEPAGRPRRQAAPARRA